MDQAKGETSEELNFEKEGTLEIYVDIHYPLFDFISRAIFLLPNGNESLLGFTF